MDFIKSIPASTFEFVGVIAGLAGCFVVFVQLIKEYKSNEPSSLSTTFLIGWLFIYMFWCLYGIRFDTIALWLTNAIAVVIQTSLCLVVFKKRRRR